jgi:pimeloyl-ACP methyl ester carboxylesterase
MRDVGTGADDVPAGSSIAASERTPLAFESDGSGPEADPARPSRFRRIATAAAWALAGGIAAEATVSWLRLRAQPIPGRLIDIGGRRLHLRVEGDAPGPAIVFEAGFGGSSVLWSLVQRDVAKFARTCSYDRAGYGFSDFGPLPRSGAQLAAELHLALVHAGLPPPYILVAHSYGGLISRLFGWRHPRDVAGLVLVDALHGALFDEAHVVMRRMVTAFGFTLGVLVLLGAVGALRLIARIRGPEFVLALPTLPPEVRRQLADSLPRDVLAAMLELNWWDATLDQAEIAKLRPDLPVIALAHDRPETFAAAGREATQYEHLWQDIQRDAIRLSGRTTLVHVRNSRHHILLESPDDVVSAVRAMIETTTPVAQQRQNGARSSMVRPHSGHREFGR